MDLFAQGFQQERKNILHKKQKSPSNIKLNLTKTSPMNKKKPISSQKNSPLDSLSNSQNKKQIQNREKLFFCDKHQETLARFFTISQLQEKKISYHCQKCVQTLKNKDIQIYELQFKNIQQVQKKSRSNSPLNVRKNSPLNVRKESDKQILNINLQQQEDQKSRSLKINYFIKQILHNQKIIYNYKLNSQQSLDNLDNLINDQFQQFDIFSQQLVEFINDFKAKYQQKILENQKALEKKNETFHSNLDTYNQQLQQIKEDIENNYSDIIHNIEDAPFSQILDSYSHQLSNFDNYISENESSTIMVYKIPPKETNKHYSPLFDQLQLNIDAFLSKQKTSYKGLQDIPTVNTETSEKSYNQAKIDQQNNVIQQIIQDYSHNITDKQSIEQSFHIYQNRINDHQQDKENNLINQ